MSTLGCDLPKAGDLQGAIQKLDYLERLGITAHRTNARTGV